MGRETPADYYEILQVDPRADQEIIERAYRLLAKRYHPDNLDTGDAKKFEILIEAYRILSDPKKRAAYDDNHQAANPYQSDIFSNAPRSGSAEGERRLYQAILLILYFARRRDSIKPGIGIVELERLVGLPEKETEFHIWYLKEKGWIQRLETGEFAITAEGVDEVIENDLLLRKDHLLPYFDESSLKKPNAGKAPNE
jgi:curved DNA-binding protein